MCFLAALASCCAANGVDRDGFPASRIAAATSPEHGNTFNWRTDYQYVPATILAGILQYRCGDYMFVISNGRNHYSAVPVANQPPVIDYSARTWGLNLGDAIPQEFWPWPRAGDGPFYPDELPYGLDGVVDVQSAVNLAKEREAIARRELEAVLGPTLADLRREYENVGAIVAEAGRVMEHCRPIFDREAEWRFWDSGLSVAMDQLLMMYGFFNPARGISAVKEFGGVRPFNAAAMSSRRQGLDILRETSTDSTRQLPIGTGHKQANIAELLKGQIVPGRAGVTITDKTVRFGDLHKVSGALGGQEVVLVRETVGGRSVMRIYSGVADRVGVPSTVDRIIGHTHPGGTPVPSPADINTLNNLSLPKIS